MSSLEMFQNYRFSAEAAIFQKVMRLGGTDFILGSLKINALFSPAVRTVGGLRMTSSKSQLYKSSAIHH